MTFEERLAEIAKGLQQFTNGLNHLTEVQASHDDKIRGLADTQQRLADAQLRNENAINHLVELQGKNEVLMSRILETLAEDGANIRALAGISATHDRRLNQLECPRA